MLFYPLTLSNIWQLLKGPQVHNPQFENHCPNTFRTHHRPLDLEAIGKNPKGTFDEVLVTFLSSYMVLTKEFLTKWVFAHFIVVSLNIIVANGKCKKGATVWLQKKNLFGIVGCKSCLLRTDV
jgi:hypothetical protein